MLMEKIKMDVKYFFMPKNTGLIKWAEKARKELILPGDTYIKKIRGEDIPFVVAWLTNQGEAAAGTTGDDLYDEARYREPKLM